MADYGPATERKIQEVVSACERFGEHSIIALAGVPGTGKSYIGAIASQRIASDPLMVRELQFHPTYSYEEFVEGYRANAAGGFGVEKGAFLDWNDQALDDPGNTYVLLLEELTRCNVPAVIGEVLTYVEHRQRAFASPYSHRQVRLATNLVFLATYNPRDRSALELDEAIIRRLNVITFPPDVEQLREMLAVSSLSSRVIDQLSRLFEECQREFAEEYDMLMPFGHGIFAKVQYEQPDLNLLWRYRLAPLLRPPGRPPHPFFEVIAAQYPWRNAEATVGEAGAS